MVYKIKLVSQTNAIVLIIILLTLFLGGVFLFIPNGLHNKSLVYLLVLGAATIAYFSWQRFVTGRTEWTIDNNQVTITWTKEFAFTNKQETILKWADIKNISRGFDPNYYNLKFKLLSGEKIKFYHDTLTTRDDFEDLLKILYQTLNDKKATANK